MRIIVTGTPSPDLRREIAQNEQFEQAVALMVGTQRARERSERIAWVRQLMTGRTGRPPAPPA